MPEKREQARDNRAARSETPARETAPVGNGGDSVPESDSDMLSNTSAVWKDSGKVLGWVVGVMICVVWSARLLLITIGNQAILYDFCQEWTSARNYFADMPIYLPMDETLPMHMKGVELGAIKYNAHPPVAVLTALPFCVLDFHSAYVAWNLVSFALLAISVWLIVGRYGLHLGGLAGLAITAVIITSNSLEHQVVQGQLNLLLLFLLTSAWIADRHGHTRVSGVFIGIAAAIKLVPAFLLLYHAARKKWGSVIAGIISFLLLNAVAAMVFGVDSYVTYFTHVTGEVTQFRDTWPNASIFGFWCKLFDGNYGQVTPIWKLPLLAKLLTAMVAICLVVFTARRVSQADSLQQRDRAFALCLVGMLLVSPITWNHYYLLLILPLGLLWQQTAENHWGRSLLLCGVVLLMTISPQRLWSLIIPGVTSFGEQDVVATPMLTITAISYQFYLLLVFYFVISRSMRPSEDLVCEQLSEASATDCVLD